MKAAAPLLIDVDREFTTREVVPQLISIKELAALMGVSTRQVYRMVHAGEFPQPVAHVGRYSRWRASDYNAWLAEQQNKPGNRRG